MTAEPVICAECGDEIVPAESAVRMAKDDGAPSDGEPRRSRLVFQFHLDCAPQELVGAWVRVYD